MQVIWVRREREYYFKQDWTGGIRLIHHSEFVFRRRRYCFTDRTPCRHADGVTPIVLLKERLKAASDS
jgi:hypothetical protein